MPKGPRSPRDCRLTRDRSPSELTGMGALLRPKGDLRSGTPGGAASNLGQRAVPRLALRLRVDAEDLGLAPLRPPLLLLHPVQSLNVGRHARHARPRGVGVRAASRGGAPARQGRGRVQFALDAPALATARPPAAAPTVPAAARAPSPRSARAPVPASAAVAASAPAGSAGA